MKKLMLLVILAVATLSVQAQSECASKKASSSTTAIADDAAAQAAALDATIDRRVCDNSGKVSYYKKNVCEKSGKVAFEQVHYDASTSQFVNVGPSQVAGEKEACASKKDGASATATSGNEKACSGASKTSGKACCASKKGKGASASVQEEKMVAPTKVNQ